jgi:hypothetical protein
MTRHICFAFLCSLLLLSLLWPAPLAHAANPADVFGVAHADGKYFLAPDEDFLNEGADQVLASGSRVLKLWLNDHSYPWNSHWPADLKTLVDVAQTPYYRAVFAKPFTTIILVAYARGRDEHFFVHGVTDEQAADETRQFYDLTKHLLTAYRGSGKTFVLQHWEGDWAIRDDHQGHIYDANYIPPQESIDGMIRWLNARQEGIKRARDEIKDSDVHVYGAFESNRVEDAMNNKPGAIVNTVLPHTTVDLASYSSYISLTSPDRLAKAVDCLAAHLPPTAVFGQNPHSVYLGEFGYPENGKDGVAGVNGRLNTVIQIVTEKQLPWAVLWQAYCNEPKEDAPKPPLNGKGHNEQLMGYWLARPDGTPSVAWHRYRRLLTTGDSSRATASAIKAKLSPLFHDDFARPDGTEMGPGWKQSAHYGPIGGHLHDHRLELDIANGDTIQWTSDTLDLSDAKVLGRGLRVGEYFEVTVQRLGRHGKCGVELFDSDQLRQAGGMGEEPSPLAAWNRTTWVPMSFDDRGEPLAFDWNQPHTIGVRFDSADGHFATVSHYVDDHYAGSWLILTGNRTLDRVGVFAQSDKSGDRFACTDLAVYGTTGPR